MTRRAALGGGAGARALVIGACRDDGIDPQTLFTGEGHAPAPLDDAECAGGRPPSPAEAADLPDWLAEALATDLGADFDPIARAMRDRAPVWLRANLARGSRDAAQNALLGDGVATQADPRCPTALLVIDGARRIQTTAAWTGGLVELQDLSAQMACAGLSVGQDTTVLDFCAGGGGKALALAARGAKVTAWDEAPARMRDLPARAARAGTPVAIASEPPRRRFDLVIADVPCSGSGTWRRTPDAKWRLTPQELARLVTVQAAILDAAATRVTEGGTLAYMTCSLLRAENDAQVAAFLSRHPRFTLESAQRMTPLGESDGFYAARLRALSKA